MKAESCLYRTHYVENGKFVHRVTLPRVITAKKTRIQETKMVRDVTKSSS